MSDNLNVEERPKTENAQNEQTDTTEQQLQPFPQEQISQLTPQQVMLARINQFGGKITLIFKICWCIGAAITFGLMIILVDMLRLFIISSRNSSSEALNTLSSLMTGGVKLIDFMNAVVKISLIGAIIGTILLVFCLYRNRGLIKQSISLKFYAFIAVQFIYVLTQNPQVSSMENLVNKIRVGSLGGLLGSALTGDYGNLGLFDTGNIVILIICFAVLLTFTLILYFNLFRNKQLNIRLSLNSKKAKVTACCLGSVAAVAIIICVGVNVYSTYIYKNEVDLMKYVNVTYDADRLSGESTASINYNWPTTYKNNVEIENFIDSIRFSLNKTSQVENGDKLEVQAVIDPSNEKKDRIKIAGNIYKDVKVSGLSRYASSIKDIPTDRIEKFESDGLNKIKDEFEDDQKNSTVTFDSLYSKIDNGHMEFVSVYAVHKVYTSEFYNYTQDGYSTYTIQNIVVDKSQNVIDKNLNCTLGYYYISKPDDMIDQGFEKVS